MSVEKNIYVTMPDGSEWGVPARLVANDKAAYYAKREGGEEGSPKYKEIFDEEFKLAMEDDLELLDWAANNMNWADVQAHAKMVCARSAMTPKEFQEGWLNGEKYVKEDDLGVP